MHLHKKKQGANDAQAHRRIKMQEQRPVIRPKVDDTGIYQTRRPAVKPSWPAISAAPAPVARHSAAGPARAPSIRPPRPPNAADTYRYRLSGCYPERIPGLGGPVRVCETVGNALTVTVSGPPPDPVETQLRATYETRLRDPDGDGVGDSLHIRRTSAAVGGGLFTHATLRKDPEGTLELVAPDSDGAPTPADVSPWPVTVSVELAPGDFDGDGFVDVLVRGLGNAIAGARDRIVFAPGQLGGSPFNEHAVDPEDADFLADAARPTGGPAPSRWHDEFVSQVKPVYGSVCRRFDARSYCAAFPVEVADGPRP